MCCWFPLAISLQTLTHTTRVCTSAPIGVPWHSLLGLSERNDYHTSVSTCHKDLLESAISLASAQALTFTDSAIRYCRLIRIVGGCLTVCLHPVCASVQLCSFRMCFHSSCSITATAPVLLCRAKMFCDFDIVLSSSESGDTYQRQVLSIFSIASGICLLGVACMALYRRNKWVMPASTTLVHYAPSCATAVVFIIWFV